MLAFCADSLVFLQQLDRMNQVPGRDLQVFGQLRHLEIHISAEELLVMDDPDRRFFSEVAQTFGDDKVNLLVIEDEDLLARNKLRVLKRVIDRLESLSFVERVDSLFSVPHLKTVGGYLNTDAYLKNLPESPDASQKLLQEAMANPFLKNVLLSPDGRTMAVAIILKDGVSGSSDHKVTASIDHVTKVLDGHYRQVFSVGAAYVRTEVAGKIRQEQEELFPWAVAVLLITLLLLLRQPVDVLVPALGGLRLLRRLPLGYRGFRFWRREEKVRADMAQRRL